ncbi:hypothetical protein [Capnocytophaga granulosa]|uniref:hypothetical protein n=1 Tax=Capnocytophaga granulosa TaxID=45242 RepID=UPI0023F570D0|nr:hypothetical protein [Capnocytophaga granulosa]
MKKYLLFIAFTLIYSCTEQNINHLLITKTQNMKIVKIMMKIVKIMMKTKIV